MAASSGLPFRELLDRGRLQQALQRAGITFRDRVFDPLTTLSAFLSQVVASKDASCEDAVSRVIAERVARGARSCSADTSSYCKARKRLPEQVLKELATQTGQDLDRNAKPEWSWKGRSVKIVDGSTAELADTVANQAEYPQSVVQKPGLGFPLLRFVTIFSLATGAIVECAVGSCYGKKSGEENLFRRLWDAFQTGDIALADCLYDSYRGIALLVARGVDCVFGKKQSRRCDFRRGTRLGTDDHVVVWKKPQFDKTRYSREEWEALPAELTMREVRCVVRRKGYRTRTIIIVTTLIDGDRYTSEELTKLFAQRWHCELDLRSLKQSLGMRRLRCLTPAMARKELWVYLLAYNLIRVRMAQVAAVYERLPRSLSFTAAKTHIQHFAIQARHATPELAGALELALLSAINDSCVGNRPGRKEPRAVKKRKQKYSYLTKPRPQARQGLPA
jgi:hypothetical protein